ncbi:MAG: DUF1543 domain-containing protein [Proteobacteria bacterium]|nr:MAG: DUF1543 domain-containing protein [Pseudomonadota bacterium]
MTSPLAKFMIVGMKTLFAVYLGGHTPNATLEVHDIAFVTGPNIKATFPQLKKLWFGDQNHVHVDSWVDLTFVDGYEVVFGDAPSKAPSRPKLFFVNAGFYEKALFGEQHRFLFLVDGSKAEVRKRVKILLKDLMLLHVDNLVEIDLIQEIALKDDYFLKAVAGGTTKPLVIHQVYWPI